MINMRDTYTNKNYAVAQLMNRANIDVYLDKSRDLKKNNCHLRIDPDYI